MAANRKSLRRHQRESKRHSVLAAEVANGRPCHPVLPSFLALFFLPFLLCSAFLSYSVLPSSLTLYCLPLLCLLSISKLLSSSSRTFIPLPFYLLPHYLCSDLFPNTLFPLTLFLSDTSSLPPLPIYPPSLLALSSYSLILLLPFLYISYTTPLYLLLLTHTLPLLFLSISHTTNRYPRVTGRRLRDGHPHPHCLCRRLCIS